LMSGTSADGVDAAIVEIDDGGVDVLAFETRAYPAGVRRRIRELSRGEKVRLADVS